MDSVVSAIRSTIPITQFNRGMAGQIFDDVKTSGTKVVMKNNVAECVLIAPENYVALIEELEDAQLLAIANARLATFNEKDAIPEDEFWKEFGISQAELDDAGEVQFE